jgi:hypothetical protein
MPVVESGASLDFHEKSFSNIRSDYLRSNGELPSDSRTSPSKPAALVSTDYALGGTNNGATMTLSS